MPRKSKIFSMSPEQREKEIIEIFARAVLRLKKPKKLSESSQKQLDVSKDLRIDVSNG